MEMIIQWLTSSVTCWKKTSRGEYQSIPRDALTEEAQIWLYFVSSSISPSRYLFTVHRDKVILVYTILERMQFDIGYFIHRSLLYAVRSKSMGGITHPHLITALCLRARVQIIEHEERVKLISELPMLRVRAPTTRAPIEDERTMEQGDMDGGEDKILNSDDEILNKEGPLERPKALAHSSTLTTDTRVMEYLHSMSYQEAFFRQQREQSDRLMGFL